MARISCNVCGMDVHTYKCRPAKYCSHSCQQTDRWAHFYSPKVHLNTGRERFTWKGKKYYLHTIAWMQANQFYFIPEGFVVHHKDMDGLNNNPDNLILLPKGLHGSLHNQIEIAQDPKRKFWGINQRGD